MRRAYALAFAAIISIQNGCERPKEDARADSRFEYGVLEFRDPTTSIVAWTWATEDTIESGANSDQLDSLLAISRKYDWGQSVPVYLSALGRKGWELVAVEDSASTVVPSDALVGRTVAVARRWTFKRQVASE